MQRQLVVIRSIGIRNGGDAVIINPFPIRETATLQIHPLGAAVTAVEPDARINGAGIGRSDLLGFIQHDPTSPKFFKPPELTISGSPIPPKSPQRESG